MSGEIVEMNDRGKENKNNVDNMDYSVKQSSDSPAMVNPDVNRLSPVFGAELMAGKKQEHYELLYMSRNLQDLINENITLIDNLILTDEQGNLVYVQTADQRIENLLTPGCSLATSRIGENGIGAALKKRVPIKKIGPEHYLHILHSFISVGIPILKGDKLIGSVGFFIPLEKDSATILQSGILDFIIETIQGASSKMLETRRYLDELFLLKEFFNKLDNDCGMILISAEGKILQVNAEAESLIGVDKNDLIGTHISSYLGDEWETMRSRDNSQAPYPIWFETEYREVGLLARLHPLVRYERYVVGYNLKIRPTVSREATNAKPNYFEFKDIIGQDKEFVRLIKLARAIAPSPSSVLISGESGTGKELFAQAIHNASYGKKGPFVAINCAAIPSELIETELFGYVEGAFTGARRGGMQGKFVQANGGTLFLDEIGDMPLELQSKLLRVLQEHIVVPVGGNQAIPVDFRLISATNQCLDELIQAGEFRADLYYRLNVINIRIPPLRERKDDIELLARHFALVYASKLGKGPIDISAEALEAMRNYNWPGNIRELENVIEMAVNLCSDCIEVEHLSRDVRNSLTDPAANHEDEVILSLEEMEKQQIIKALLHFEGNISQTANVLEIGRTTLYRKMKKYDLFEYVKQ